MITKSLLDAAVHKFFFAMSGLLNDARFEITESKEYDANTDSTKKRIYKVNVKYIDGDFLQEQENIAGMQKREIVIYCKASDFKVTPSVKDFFYTNKECYNITKVEPAFNAYIKITGEK
jgi:hypothetical protein